LSPQAAVTDSSHYTITIPLEIPVSCLHLMQEIPLTMSRHISFLRLAVLSMLLLFAVNSPVSAQNNYDDNASYQQFYDELSPYGEWVDDPQYGYVWVPDAGDDFRPYYSNGYWTNTDYGNTWVSNYNWGWAPFHYGRWTYDSYYGWVWIPGNVWGPAWVSWRSGGGSYGWAPLGPGISISLSFGNSYYVPDYWWIFTPQQYILNPRFHQHTYGPRYNTNYIRQTTIINNTYVHNNHTYVTGPRRTELERATGRPVKAVSIRNSSRPDRARVRGNSLNIYRPAIAESNPRASERPRQFRTAEQPITAPPRQMSAPIGRRADQQPTRSLQPERTRQSTDRPVLNNNAQPVPRIERQQPDRSILQQPDRQQPRPAEVQPQRSRPDWNSGSRMPERTPVPQPQQRIDRAPMNRNMESPRVQPAQPVPQQRIERPRIEQPRPTIQPQRTESPRMEAPRTMPQRQEPVVQPMRSDRPQMNSESARPMRR